MAAEEAEILSLTMLNYERSWVVEFFHKFPHFDFSFQPINSTFDPGNESYTQVLLIWGCVPVLWLALTYLTLFIYMLCQCCVKPTAKVQQITCQKWALVIFGLLCCGVLGVGLYGNESTHRGVHGFADSFQSAEETFQSTENQ
ncbi:PREDICTED: protein tweety homolog 2-like, partial [Priapulus caudatus]|uniref:Protein tweety homolog n=1 Tax=Priapulus caudatus TaxID=37621 RepID=A0ABM1ESS2_PRICU